MRKYAVCIDRILFMIFSAVGCEISIEDICQETPVGSYAVVVSLSGKADFCVRCYSSDGIIMKEPHLPFVALSFFLRRIRGLPLDEVEIEFLDTVYNLDISTSYTPCYRKIPQKCKSKLSKAFVFEDKTEVSCYDITGSVEARIAVVPCAESFSHLCLCSLLVRGGHSVKDVSIAASYNGEVHVSASNGAYPFEYISLAVCALILDGIKIDDGEYNAHFSGGIHRFRIVMGKIIFLPDPEPLNFY